jgi:monovalent cation:proton antiporter-2 (CPA2) family protein
MEPHAELALGLPLALLAAAVAGLAASRVLRLSPIVAYIAAGMAIGPFGAGVVVAPDTILTVAELGVVLLLFIIGLELEFSRLLGMRRAIFGLGAAQLAVTAAAISAVATATGLSAWRGAVVAGLALAMSSTAIALRILDDRGDLQQPYGQRAFAILLFQDMSVVPLLALLPLLAPGGGAAPSDLGEAAFAAARIAFSIAAVIAAGRWLLNPLFRLLAVTGAREAMTAGALLVVLGAAALMHAAGMSMALGAFLAGVMLAESNFRHELEADIEPFRGLLLALFFMGVGMAIDVDLVRRNLVLIVAAAAVVSLLKMLVIWVLFLPMCDRQRDALQAGSVLTSAGEFAFVLIPLGVASGVLGTAEAGLYAAIAAATMVMGPPLAALTRIVLRRFGERAEPHADEFDDARGTVLLVGFGRFGQIVAQCLLAESVDVVTIDTDPEMIENAGRFGFKVYYGDGTRLDVLRAAGADKARLVAVCVDAQATADRVVDLVRTEFPAAALFVRSFDRRHTLRLLGRGVDYEIRETFESALSFGGRVLERLGLSVERAGDTVEFVRRRDLDRLAVQQAEGIYAGTDLLKTRRVRPQPVSEPRRGARPLNPEAGAIMERPKQDAEAAAGQ